MLTSDDGRGLIDRNKHHDKNEGAKKPQLPEDHSQVVTGAAQHGMHRVTERPLQPVPIELPSVFMWPMAGSIALRRLIIARNPRVMPRLIPGW
ncbi:hypothetical protein OKW50_007674 [Paraburkholderia youngii]